MKRPITDPDEERAISEALEAARHQGVLRIYPDLASVLRISERFVDPLAARPVILENWVPRPDDIYMLGFTLPRGPLKRGCWYGLTVHTGEQSGIAVIVVVDQDVWQRLVEGTAL